MSISGFNRKDWDKIEVFSKTAPIKWKMQWWRVAILKKLHRQDFWQDPAINQVCHTACCSRNHGLTVPALAQCAIHVNINNVHKETSLIQFKCISKHLIPQTGTLRCSASCAMTTNMWVPEDRVVNALRERIVPSGNRALTTMASFQTI